MGLLSKQMNCQEDRSAQTDDALTMDIGSMALSETSTVGIDVNVDDSTSSEMITVQDNVSTPKESTKNSSKKKKRIRQKVRFHQKHQRSKLKKCASLSHVSSHSRLYKMESEVSSRPSFSPCEEKNSTDSLETSPAYKLYVTSTDLQDAIDIKTFADKFKNNMKDRVWSKMKVRQICCGLIVTLYNEDDLGRVLRSDLAKMQGVPVQVTKFSSPMGERYRRFVAVTDVPWCITCNEIHGALKSQGMHPGKITRSRGLIRIELLNACDVERLLMEGLNFYNCAVYPTALENPNYTLPPEQEIVQCYRCQGFWHTSGSCQNQIRCVRCGENHTVEYCQRSRSNPICCNCGGSHHAAYRFCPVRLQLLKSIQISFTLSRGKPDSGFYNFK